MIIARYGIKLIRLERKHIETVRTSRNAPSIRDFMEYREHITPEMQESWFDSLDYATDFYFVIEYKSELIGLIHTSDIDWGKLQGNAGLFIWKKELQSTFLPVLASLSMVDFFFCFTSLQRIFAKVMNDNKVAIDYNKHLGFKLADGQKGKEFQEYVMEKENYFSVTTALHDSAKLATNNNYSIKINQDLVNFLSDENVLDKHKFLKQGNLVSITTSPC